MTPLNRTDRRLLELLQRDGHLTNLERSAEFNRLVEAFIKPLG